MWVRKSAEEITHQNVRARFSPVLPFLIAAGISGAFALSGTWRYSSPQDSSVAISQLPFNLLLIFCALYLIQVIRGGWTFRPDSRASICSRCHGRIAGPRGSGLRPCGGDREPLRNWRWVPDDHPDRDRAEGTTL